MPEVPGELEWKQTKAGPAPEISYRTSDGEVEVVRVAVSILADPVKSLPRQPGKVHRVRCDLDEDERPIRVRPWEVARTVEKFHNPYNFIPGRARSGVAGVLGDQPPASHALFDKDRYSGSIAVRMTAKTPILVPDAARAVQEHDHWTFPLRRSSNGEPLIPPTSIKGMLRAAYEAVTNSRFGVFKAHEHPLGLRLPARAGLSLVPVRIETDAAGILVARLMTGTASIGPNGHPQENGKAGRAYAARVAMALLGDLPHGAAVTCVVEERQERAWSYWRVRRISAGCADLAGLAAEGRLAVHGWLSRTGQNIGGKRDERVFFAAPDTPMTSLPVTGAVAERWHALIKDYQDIHREERSRGITRPPALPDWCVWSRHIVAGVEERELTEGTLCYASLTMGAARVAEIDRLYPVLLSRDLFDASPEALLHETLCPARTIEELSPADRVFGWVAPERVDGGEAAGYRGNLRIGAVRPDPKSTDPISHNIDPPLPLSIMGQPKPSQARFYAADGAGRSLDGIPSSPDLYRPGHRLRGRKVYPHHARLPVNHWQARPPNAAPALGETWPEYRRPGGIQDNQNRSITGWIAPGACFRFDIHVTNLSKVELGALLWLLDLNASDTGQVGTTANGLFHRLGGGKPLGFGSVRMEVVGSETKLSSGGELAAYYRDLSALAPVELDAAARASMISAFHAEVETHYGAGLPFPRVDFVAAFLAACQGDARFPTHYPRISTAPTQEGNNYEWFRDNEAGKRLGLPLMADRKGLPIKPGE